MDPWRRFRTQVVGQHPFRFRIAITALVIASALFALCLACLFYPAARARYLFNQVESLQLGRSTYEDAEALAQKIGATPYPPYGPCSRSDCEWSLRIDNAELPRWWRGAGESFGVAFDVKDSKVVRKTFGYGVGILNDGFFPSSVGLTELEHWPRQHRPVLVEAGWYSTDLYPYWDFRVSMIPGASAQDRRRYSAYDYGCMWKYRGCKDGRELLPVAASMPPSHP